MQNIGLYSQLGKQIDNFFRPFSDLVTKPQLGNLKEMARGLIQGESSHLLRIGEQVAKGITPRKNTERYSRTLEKIDTKGLQQQNILNAFGKFSLERSSGDPVLIIPDGGDIQKPHGEKIQHLCRAVDGSNSHTPGKGFPLLGIMAYGTKSKKKVPLVTHLYSTQTETFKSQWDEQKQWMDALAPLTSTHNAIVVEDAIADDNQRINYYRNEMGCGFLVRLTTKRNFLWKEDERDTAFQKIPVKELAEQLKEQAGSPRSYWNKKLKQKLTSRIAWTRVEHEGLLDQAGERLPLFLIVVHTDEFPNDPMLLLTDQHPELIENQGEDGAWKLFFWYKERWEIEKYYREIKQLFRVEKTLLRSYKALQGLLTIIMLVYGILKKMISQKHRILGDLKDTYYEWVHKWQKYRDLEPDQEPEDYEPTVSTFIAFIREILEDYQPLFTHHYLRWKIFSRRFSSDPLQSIIFDFRRKW